MATSSNEQRWLNRRVSRLCGIVAATVIATLPNWTGAVSCPPLGAKVEVCIKNDTSDTPTVFVAGSAVSNEITCTGPAPILGRYQANVPLGANQTTCAVLPGAGSGLVTGMVCPPHLLCTAANARADADSSSGAVPKGAGGVGW